MRHSRSAGVAMVFLGVSGLAAQSAGNSAAAPLAGAQPPNEMVREIDDPATGARWLLERYGTRPGGPGRLVMVWPGGIAAARSGTASAAPAENTIRPGDRILLVAHTAVMDAELEAVALAPAAAGDRLRVRLKIGGRVLEAVARGPGRAEWLPEVGERP